MTPGVEYHTLVGDDVLKMADKIAAVGFSLPHPQLATVEIAIVEGELAGFGVTQLVFHGEPLFVLPKYRGMGIAEELADRMRKVIETSNAKTYVCVAENEFAEELCRKNGMVAVPGTIFVKNLG